MIPPEEFLARSRELSEKIVSSPISHVYVNQQMVEDLEGFGEQEKGSPGDTIPYGRGGLSGQRAVIESIHDEYANFDMELMEQVINGFRSDVTMHKVKSLDTFVIPEFGRVYSIPSPVTCERDRDSLDAAIGGRIEIDEVEYLALDYEFSMPCRPIAIGEPIGVLVGWVNDSVENHPSTPAHPET